jgi:hypothetical protein
VFVLLSAEASGGDPRGSKEGPAVKVALRVGSLGSVVLGFVLWSGGASASSLYGPLDNFDVVNDTGQETCGFEIEIEGVHK